jgi:hypothetical protein
MYALLSMLVIGHVSCKKDKTDENTVKVCIAFDSPDKKQKIYVDASSSIAAIYWTNGTQIRMINASNQNFLLQYTGSNQRVANFSIVGEGSMSTGDYIGFYPANASVTAYNNIVFTTPDAYTIDPTNVDAYLINNLLMFTYPKYSHGGDDTAFFKPAMSILELPIKTDSGNFQLTNIKLTAIGPPPTGIGAFIKEGKLPDVIGNTPYMNLIEHKNTIEYQISGTGLEINTTPKALKLLVWSNNSQTFTLQHYELTINNTITKKFKTDKDTIFNSTYYKLPTFEIVTNPDPEDIEIGNYYAGGIVFHIFQEGELGYVPGETHGLVCDTLNLGSFPWGCSSVLVSGTSPLIGYGESNTQTIVNAGCNGTAAMECSNYNGHGYNDWFLPSKDELDSMRRKVYYHPKGHFGSNVLYLPSTENGQGGTFVVPFNSWYGAPYWYSKSSSAYVRPVRKF